jgi:hypothetical protein
MGLTLTTLPLSAVPARLGLKALALASMNTRPGQSCQLRLGSGLAWPGPRLLYVKLINFRLMYRKLL